MTNQKNLETKMENPNWKQSLPVYGIYQACKDSSENKSSIINDMGSIKSHLYTFYQCSSFLAAGVGLSEGAKAVYNLAEKFL